MSTLLRSDFPATYLPTAFDLRNELVQLNKLVRRSSAAVSRQIEVYIDTLYDTVKTGALVGVAPDGTTAATVTLKQLYSDFTDFTRAERIKIDRLLALSNNAAVKTAVAAQLAYWLEVQGWVLYAIGAVLTDTITVGGTFSASDGVHAFTQASTSGVGTGFTGIATISGNTVTAITYTTRGSGYVAADTVVLSIPTATASVACTVTIDSVAA